MAFFKFRKSGDEQSATPAQAESVAVMRRRAKHRLIGAAVLLLIGVIGFPLLFDKQPRPISVDTPIDIPDRNKIRPLNISAPVAIESVKPDTAAPVEPAVPVPPAAAAPEAPKATLAKVEPEPKATEKAVEKMVAKVDDGAKAQSLLEDRGPANKADASDGRYVVQVGAFADAARAREVRLKVEQAGLKTYTQVAGTKDAPRIRVRVGPFGTRAEADKAVEKIKRIDLPAAILTL